MSSDESYSYDEFYSSDESYSSYSPFKLLVKPQSAENTLVPEDWESTISFWNDGVKVSGRSRFTSSNETFEREPPATPLKNDASINVQPDDSTPALHIFPSDVILVKPASAENTLVPEDWESTISFWNDGVKVSGRSRFTSSNETFECEPPASPLKDDSSINVQPDDNNPALHIFPSDVILVKPASAENTLVLEDWDCAVRFQTDEVKVSVDILPSDEILVRPETAENAALHEDQESAVSLQSELEKASESFISEESITHEDIGMKKKKKNCIRRFFSWMRKTFCCCVACVDDDD